jgi:hypothetical protein
MLRRNCFLQNFIEETVEKDVRGSGVRRRKQLLDGFTETRGYWKWKEEALDGTVWRTGFGRDCGPVVRLKTEWKNEYSPNNVLNSCKH